MSAAQPGGQRKDARRNRAAILDAARELFSESGDVPMYEIGRRAGVGQATLYRHFPDRAAVAQALFAEQLDRLERLASEHGDDPAAFLALMREVAAMQAEFHGLAEAVGPGARGPALKKRFVAVIAKPLRDAKAAGLVRRDLSLDDVFLVIAMVGGALDRRDDPAAAGVRAVTLVVEGLAA